MKSILNLALELRETVNGQIQAGMKPSSHITVEEIEGITVTRVYLLGDVPQYFVSIPQPKSDSIEESTELSCELVGNQWTIRVGEEIVAASNTAFHDERYVLFPANTNFVPLEDVFALPIKQAIRCLVHDSIFANVCYVSPTEKLEVRINNPGTNENLSSTPSLWYRSNGKQNTDGIPSKYYAAEIIIQPVGLQRLILLVFDVRYENYKAYWLDNIKWNAYNVSGRIPPLEAESTGPHSKSIEQSMLKNGKVIPDHICIGEFEGIREYLMSDNEY